MVGQHVGKYRVLDRVGRGGMGTVYRAIDETLQREVAIKVLNAELNEPEVAKRFRAEAITVARLSHPGIATIYELFQHDDQWLMVMEFLRGETLEQTVARAGALAPEQAAALCMQGLAALAHAHSMGVVHRDLKPANIMRTDAGDVKIMDFGIARVSGSEHLTNVGFMMGTPAYMAPEQVQGHEIDARADLYAIGVVFFRLLTGQLPFKGDTPFAMAQAQVNAPPIPIETMRPGTPAWVSDVLAKALEKKPEDRFQSAAAFHDALHQAVVGNSGAMLSPALAPTGVMTTPARALPINPHAETMLTPAATASAPIDAGTTPARPPAPAPPVSPSIVDADTPVTAPRPVDIVAPPVAPPRPTTPAPAPPVAAVDAPVAAVPAAVPAGRAMSTWIGAAAAIALVAAGALWWATSSRNAEAPEADAVILAESVPLGQDIELLLPLPETTAETGPIDTAATAPSGGRGTTTPVPAPASAMASSEPAAPPAPLTTEPPSRAEPPPAPVDVAPPVEIANVRVLVLDGRRATDHDATLNLGNGRIVAVGQRDGTPLVTWPYQAVTAATYVHARTPRWNPDLASPPSDLDVGGVFRASRHYLTLQNANEFIILRLEDINVIQVIRELEARTGLSIPRTSGGN